MPVIKIAYLCLHSHGGYSYRVGVQLDFPHPQHESLPPPLESDPYTQYSYINIAMNIVFHSPGNILPAEKRPPIIIIMKGRIS